MDHLLKRFLVSGLLFFAALLTFSIYWPGLMGGFFFDDYPNIVLNPGIKVENTSWESLSLAWSSGTAGQFGRPVSQLSFALNYHFSGFSPFAFKLTNLVIHGLNGLLLYLLCYQILDSVRLRLNELTNVRICAAVVASAWMIHPIQLTSVLYVVQRMTSLSVFFVLAALIFHILARRRIGGRWITITYFVLAWVVFWPLSIFSKETGILLPGFVAAYELIIRRAERGGLDALGRGVRIITVVLLVGLIPYLASPFGQWILSGYEIRSFNLLERLLTESRVIWGYLYWMFFPRLEQFALFHDDIAISSSFVAPWFTPLAVIGFAGMLVGVFAASRRFPVPAFGIAWFLIGHSLESTFIPLELVHEHRNYLPLFGILLLPVGPLSDLAAKPGVRRTLTVAIVGAVLAYFSFVTFIRAEMFANEQIRTQLEAQFHPDSARTNYEAGRALATVVDRDRGNMIAAVLAQKHFEKATALDPDYKMGLLGVITLKCGILEEIDHDALVELNKRLEHALVLQEDTTILSAIVEMAGAGLSCLKRSDIDALFASLFANPRLAPDKRVAMHSLHADYLWLHEKDLRASRSALKSALEISPQNPSLRLKWAQLDFLAGDRFSARELLDELRDEPLTKSEKETIRNLLAILEDDGG